jgi:hypothetical protein
MTVPRRAPSKKRRTTRRFPERVFILLRNARILGIRAGTGQHRFTGIWFVLVRERLFVRPWNDKPFGWHRTLLQEPRGVISLSGQEIPVRARRTRGEALWNAVDDAYAEKYRTKASLKWVRGFQRTRRRATTTELLPDARTRSS